jgi:predicted dehydrogenase
MTVSLAILGASGNADHYAGLLSTMADVEVRWVYSRERERAERLAGLPPAATAILATIWADTDLNVVLVLCEPARHVELAGAALANHKHVLIEKPLHTELEEARRFARQVETSDRVVAVVSQKRYDPALRKLYRDWQGQPGFQGTAHLEMHWYRQDSYFTKGDGWRKRDSAVFINQGIHWLDVVQWFFGQPLHCEAESRVTRDGLSCPDWSQATVGFDSGTVMTLSGGTNYPQSLPERFELKGSSRTLDYSTYSRTVQRQQRLLSKLTGRQSQQDLLGLQLQIFFAAIQERRSVITSAKNALNALILALAISYPDRYRLDNGEVMVAV